MSTEATWRGPYVENCTFEMCHNFDMPEWINLLPSSQASSSRTLNAEAFDEELRTNLH